MKRNYLAAAAVAVMAGTASADYMFPTAYPSGVKMDTVKQIVSFIWDDNAYSGLAKTDYELHPDSTQLFILKDKPASDFKNHNWVGGMKPWSSTADASINKLNIQEGDMGMSWALTKLAGRDMPVPEWDAKAIYKAGMQCAYQGVVWQANYEGAAGSIPKESEWSGGQWKKIGPVPDNIKKKNPDGSPIHFTFNVISGLFVPIIGAEDGQRVSKYGYWQPNAKDLIEFPHLDAYKSGKMPIAWGREMPVKATADAEGNVNGEAYGRINDAFKITKDFGHEIGNHTIDHLESNSMLPNAKGPFPAGTRGEWYVDGFARWGGDGFAADSKSPMKWGDLDSTADEAADFGREEGITWHYLGWELYAGKTLPLKAWKGLIELGEEELTNALGLKPLRSGGTVGAFRAPRLEVNGYMHDALKELGYLYDCGQEEGYEYHIDGTNFYWPYTTDNGTPNASWQRQAGENVALDAMPAGLWQYPVNAMIVPQELREKVWANYAVVSEAEGHPQDQAAKDHWIQNDGRITGFDFNMFILWGMTKETALATLKYNLDQRMKGGKAPMQIGCHTDYFTPIYDHATLLTEANRSTYGLCLDKGWNNWEDRKATFEEFIDYGLNDANHKGKVYFWSGAKAIEYARKISEQDQIGTTVSPYSGEWKFFSDEVNSTSNTASFNGNIAGAKISAKAANGDKMPSAGFETYFAAGTLKDLDHVSLTYQSNAPLALVICSGDDEREVWLNNINKETVSGAIPLSAFHYNQYFDGVGKPLDVSAITGFKIIPILSGKKETAVEFTVKDFKTYSGSKVSNSFAAQQKKMTISLASATPNALSLNLPAAGAYSVDVYSLNGKVVHSVKGTSLKAGMNTLNMNSVAPGMYLVNVSGLGVQKTIKAVIR